MRRNLPTPPASSAILYIGLIPFEWDEDNLKAVVCGLGNVIDVRLGFDHVGKNRGYAFVEFETPQQAMAAKALVGKILVVHPVSRQLKKLKVELSKEGFRSGQNSHRPVIPLDARKLPPGVQFPPEVVAQNPQLRNLSPMPQSGHGQDQGMAPQGYNGPGAAPLPPPPGQTPNSIPETLLRATQSLPPAEGVVLATPDKTNETLSQIKPPELIEVLANLKNIINGPNASSAADVFLFSPHLASAATQALLLMGFIDEEVIKEAMKPPAAAPVSAPPALQGYQNQGYQNQGYQNQGYQNQGYQNQGYQNQPSQQYNQSGFGQPPQGMPPRPVNLPPHPQTGGQRAPPSNNRYNSPGPPNNAGLPPTPAMPSNPGRWPGLLPLAQAKLAQVPKEQVDLIVQVLALTPDQVSALPPDKQEMVAGIRQQYM